MTRQSQLLDVEDLLRVVEPGALPRGRDVVDPVLVGLDQLGERRRQVPRVGGRADLVGDHDDLRLLAGQPQHRLDEVAAAGAEEP